MEATIGSARESVRRLRPGGCLYESLKLGLGGKQGVNTVMDYPADADGDALRRVAADGSDMTKPMSVDFHVSVPSRQSAEAVVSAARKLGFVTEIWDHEEGDTDWTAECTKIMVVTYETIGEAQRVLTELAAPHGGSCSEWGMSGNTEVRQHQVQALDCNYCRGKLTPPPQQGRCLHRCSVCDRLLLIANTSSGPKAVHASLLFVLSGAIIVGGVAILGGAVGFDAPAAMIAFNIGMPLALLPIGLCLIVDGRKSIRTRIAATAGYVARGGQAILLGVAKIALGVVLAAAGTFAPFLP